MKTSNTNYNLYKTFVVVYETQNTTKASELLFTSQSTVSYSIKELEKQLGTQLFVAITRGAKRGVQPTQAATELYNYVISALNTLNNGENRIQQFNELSTGVIRIGCPSYIANNILLDYLCEFNKKYPRIKLEIANKLKSELRDMLEKHDIDFLVDTSPIINDENFVIVDLMEMSYTFFASKTFLKENNLQTKISKEQLKTLPIILHNRSHRMIQNLNDKLGFEITPNIEATSSELMYGMVLKNMGIGYCVEPFLLNGCNREQIVKIKLDTTLPITELVFAYHKDDTNNATQAFLIGLKEFCKKSDLAFG